MAELFEPSPRATKRRKTTTPKATYGSKRTLIHEVDVDKASPIADHNTSHDTPAATVISGTRLTRSQEKNETSLRNGSGHARHSSEAESDLERISDLTKAGPRKAHKDAEERGHTPVSMEQDDAADVPDQTQVPPTRSSGRERKRPRRFSISPEKPRSKKKSVTDEVVEVSKLRATSASTALSAATKGILTPSRKDKRQGPPKSVAFDRDGMGIEEQFGFKDIESPTKRSRTPRLKHPPQKTKTSKDNESIDTLSEATLQHSNGREETIHDLDDQSEDMMVDELLESAQQIDDDLISPVEEIPIGTELNEESSHVLAIKSMVLSRCYNATTSKIPEHLQTQLTTIHQLLAATVSQGESNSLLLLGARGAGKSLLVNSALRSLSQEFDDEFHVVKLDGFVQTDDRIALREIWKQLGREMQVDEDETAEVQGSYADTMASLLSLLSHPDELVMLDESALAPTTGKVRNESENNESITEERIRTTSKSIIFILDEFDLFTTHPRQTLLYNLFDIAQSKKAPIAVVGCSARMDVVECLEKRVKSRFSHRWLHVPTAKSVEGFQAILQDTLFVDSTTMELSEDEAIWRKAWNKHIQCDFIRSASVQNSILEVFYSTKSISDLLCILYLPLASIKLSLQLENEVATVAESQILTSRGHAVPNNLQLLPELPTLHLSLLIAAARLDTIHNLTALNFNLVYAHYAELIARSKLQHTASGAVAVGGNLRQWARESAQAAWEDLGLWGLIIPITGAGAAGLKDGDAIGGEGASVRMWRVDAVLEEVDWAVRYKWTSGPGIVQTLSKWCREV